MISTHILSEIETIADTIGLIIVSAYQNKIMHLMFSYSIKRQKILTSQMLAF